MRWLGLGPIIVAMASCGAFGDAGEGVTSAPDAGDDDGGSQGDAGVDAAPPGCVAPACVSVVGGLGGRVAEVVVSSTDVIFTVSPGGIFACPHAGCSGPPRELAALQRPRHLVYFDETVYWVDEDAGEARGVPVSGGPPFLVYKDAIKGLAPTASGIWVARGFFLTRCPLVGGGNAACSFSPSADTPLVLASEGAYVYWVSARRTVHYLDSAGASTGPVLAVDESEPAAAFAAADSFYLLRGAGAVVRVERKNPNPDAGAPAPLLTGIAQPAGITVIAETVFVTSGTGDVVSVPVAGGPSRVIASGLASPRGITGHQDSLYVAVADGVVRLRR